MREFGSKYHNASANNPAVETRKKVSQRIARGSLLRRSIADFGTGKGVDESMMVGAEAGLAWSCMPSAGSTVV
jgi:hypothetical protein